MIDNNVYGKTLLIAEEDKDLSNSLALLFSGKLNVKVIDNYTTIGDDLASAFCLLIDVKIVNAFGIDFLRSIKKSYPNVLIIIMHGITSERNSKHDLYSQYADANVFKPFDADHISRIILQLKKENTDIPT